MQDLNIEIQKHINQLLSVGKITIAEKLNQNIISTDYKLQEHAVPMFFTGKLDAKIVFIELNPGLGLMEPTITDNKISLDKFGIKNLPEINDVNSYVEFFENFGKYKAESLEQNGKKIKGFDSKQLYFFSGFGLLGLEDKSEFGFNDMIEVRKEKLQLELVPYASRKFNFKNFSPDYLKERFSFNQKIIDSYNRDFVFITGNMGQLVKIMEFAGLKISERKKFSVSGRSKEDLSIAFALNGKMPIILLPSYKNQSLHSSQMKAYGKVCKELYDSFKDSLS
jgi:hypothetical protein